MKNKKFKQDYDDEGDDETVFENDKKTSPKRKAKKQKEKVQVVEEPKKPLIERIDEELNQIEFCNLNDFATSSTKLSFDGTNRAYFSAYFLDKVIDCNSQKANVLSLSSLGLDDDCLGDLLNLRNLIDNESFKSENTYGDESQMLARLEGYFSNIEMLDLSDNKLLKIPFRLMKLFENLRHVKLNNNLVQYKNSDLNELLRDESNENNKRLFRTIEYLNLENNKLDSNLTFLSLFKNLRYLNLSNNFITNLSLSHLVAQLLKLVDLNVGSNQQLVDSQILHETAARHTEHQSLKKLNLRNMNLNNLIYNIEGFKNLEHLILDDNRLEFLPTQLYELEKLKILSMSSNKLMEISDKFCLKSRFKSNLQQLNLSNNVLSSENFSEKFYLLKNLTKLDLSDNKFKYIPSTLPESLRELKLGNNRILTLMIRPVRLLLNVSATKISPEDDLEILERLRQRLMNSTAAYTASTQIQQLHYSTVFYLRNLEYLDLSSNQIQEIPNDFGLLNVSLKYLNLSCNLIKQLDLKLCCRGLYNLKYLNLSSNFIKYIPEQICEFKQLEYLFLNHNSIQYLNYELCNELDNLIELDLSFNQISELPIFTHKNGKLQAITLSQALTQVQDSDLPHYFTFCLKNLKKINLSSNKLHSVLLFAVTFSQCEHLAEVNLSCNFINSIKIEYEQQQQQQEQQQKPKRISLLKELILINLSNNQISLSEKEDGNNLNKKLLRLLLRFYKLAPTLKTFLYDQENGTKINMSLSLDNDNEENSALDIDELLIDYGIEYELLIKNLQVINLSNNNLYKIPSILFKMNTLKELYLNGNYIQKIPSSILHVTRTISLIDNAKPAVAVAAVAPPNEAPVLEKTEITKIPSLVENIERLELNDNKLEQVPENLFIHFKNLKNLKLNNNPLKEPPRDAICAGFIEESQMIENSSNIWSNISSIHDEEVENEILSNLSEASNESINGDELKLGPMRSYMIKYKKREEMLLVNMFATIKDAIDSHGTLFKLMRRLKMPMDKVEIVCNEIAENIKLNWTKRLDKTQLRIKKKDLPKVQREYILRIQTWKLLNIWRQLYGIDAHSDELLRVLNLMNSNDHEEALLNKVKSLKFYSSAIKI